MNPIPTTYCSKYAYGDHSRVRHVRHCGLGGPDLSADAFGCFAERKGGCETSKLLNFLCPILLSRAVSGQSNTHFPVGPIMASGQLGQLIQQLRSYLGAQTARGTTDGELL